MPIYEYECDACGEHEEHMQPMAEPPKRICSRCGAEALRRLISATAFHLKGGGWYKDGYASRSPPSGTSKTDAGSTSEGGSDKPKEAKATTGTKPAGKKED